MKRNLIPDLMLTAAIGLFAVGCQTTVTNNTTANSNANSNVGHDMSNMDHDMSVMQGWF